jgi:Cu+-exporting ATPase
MKKTITVTGMHCEHCASRVEKALTASGGRNVRVDLEKGIATGDFSSSDAELKNAVEEIGFDVAQIV